MWHSERSNHCVSKKHHEQDYQNVVEDNFKLFKKKNLKITLMMDKIWTKIWAWIIQSKLYLNNSSQYGVQIAYGYCWREINPISSNSFYFFNIKIYIKIPRRAPEGKIKSTLDSKPCAIIWHKWQNYRYRITGYIYWFSQE